MPIGSEPDFPPVGPSTLPTLFLESWSEVPLEYMGESNGLTLLAPDSPLDLAMVSFFLQC